MYLVSVLYQYERLTPDGYYARPFDVKSNVVGVLIEGPVVCTCVHV